MAETKKSKKSTKSENSAVKPKKKDDFDKPVKKSLETPMPKGAAIYR